VEAIVNSQHTKLTTLFVVYNKRVAAICKITNQQVLILTSFEEKILALNLVTDA
jgi:hypothetical protein